MTALDFPVALRLDGRRVLLVGGGSLAEQRLESLLQCGAVVRVVAPRVSARIDALASAHGLAVERRPFRAADCDGAFVVFTAADDRAVNRSVVSEARARGVLVNAADAPELCDFFVPSVGRRGAVTVAVSTAGLAPGLARHLRHKVMSGVGMEYAALARVLGWLRRRLPGGPARKQLLDTIVVLGGAELLARGDRRGLFALIRQELENSRASLSKRSEAA